MALKAAKGHCAWRWTPEIKPTKMIKLRMVQCSVVLAVHNNPSSPTFTFTQLHNGTWGCNFNAPDLNYGKAAIMQIVRDLWSSENHLGGLRMARIQDGKNWYELFVTTTQSSLPVNFEWKRWRHSYND